MMLPRIPYSTMTRATRCVQRITCLRLERYRASHPFSDVSSSGELKTPPALLTRMLTGPSSATVRSSAASTCPESRTSVGSPRPPTSSPAAVAVSLFCSQTATLAPKAANPRAIPRPIPDPPPVTAATGSGSRTEDGSMGTRGQYSSDVAERESPRVRPGAVWGLCAEDRTDSIGRAGAGTAPDHRGGGGRRTLCHTDTPADLRLQDAADPDDERGSHHLGAAVAPRRADPRDAAHPQRTARRVSALHAVAQARLDHGGGRGLSRRAQRVRAQRAGAPGRRVPRPALGRPPCNRRRVLPPARWAPPGGPDPPARLS